ncbi:MAG: NAD-dependent epimerase/dehydratase family protein [Candidatus Omnitrophica bacterium]|nr:NAD-dependent epimerase/dehydratase family protein [Candidatus Omnitrophota bacterium]
MAICLITGSGGLIGSESVVFFSGKNFKVIGIDNDMRNEFFGKDASTREMVNRLKGELVKYTHYNTDIRYKERLRDIFAEFNKDIKLIIHAAAQPSHDWAASDPQTDFAVNAVGTNNLLQLALKFCPKTAFIYLSTNKVYGDLPNFLPLRENKERWDLPPRHEFYNGISERMSIDRSTHSLFGVSKLAGDLLVQEYGNYFGMKTVCFRGGCLSGGKHQGVKLHGFLSYLMKCCIRKEQYTIYGYKGKQVRDNIHSADLAAAFYEFYKAPKKGEVYNIGGGRQNSCSILQAIRACERICGNKMKYNYIDRPRKGDHKWYISDIGKFKRDYPAWKQKYGLEGILGDICDNLTSK